MSETKLFKFTKDNLEKANQHVSKYPKTRSKSAIKSSLDLAQRQNNGWITKEIMDYIASYLKIAPMRVYEVVTFYTMFNLEPVKKFVVNVCTTTPCMLRGSADIFESCKAALNEDSGADFFTVKEVECLGACVNAPVVQINDDYYEDLSVEKIVTVLDCLRKGKKINTGSQIDRQCAAPVGFKSEKNK